MIVAMETNNGIGLKNELPWNIPKDMKYFRDKTIGNGNNAVVMGRNTYLSIGKPLKKRDNIVVSTTMSLQDGVIILNNPEYVFDLEGYDEVWIIGGAQLYTYFINKSNFIDEIYITRVKGSYECDAFFPKVPDHLIKTELYSDDNLSFEVYRSK